MKKEIKNLQGRFYYYWGKRGNYPLQSALLPLSLNF